jgi:hypothetical protein
VAIADRAHRAQLGAVARGDQLAHLLEQAAFDHRLAAAVDPRVEVLALGRERQVQHAIGRILEAVRAAHVAGRPAGLGRDLERAHDPPRVVRVDPRGRVRVALEQAPVEPARVPCPLGAALLLLELLAQLLVGLDAVDQAVKRGADVQARAAREQRHAPARVDRRDRRARLARITAGAVALVGRHDVEQVVRHARALGRARLGRADVHESEHLHRVGVHDLAGEAQRELDRERRLATRGRPGHDDDGRSLRFAGHPGEPSGGRTGARSRRS